MEYSKTYFLRYLSCDSKTRAASKAHWLKIYAANFQNGIVDELSSSILAAIALADDMIANGLVVYA